MTVVEDETTSSPDCLQFDAAHKGKVRRYILRAASDVSITEVDPVLEMAQWRDTLLRHHRVALDRQQHPGGTQSAIQRMRCVRHRPVWSVSGCRYTALPGSALEGELLARETASKTDETIPSWPHNNASSAPWSSTPSNPTALYQLSTSGA